MGCSDGLANWRLRSGRQALGIGLDNAGQLADAYHAAVRNVGHPYPASRSVPKTLSKALRSHVGITDRSAQAPF
jgi:hypothetical protein